MTILSVRQDPDSCLRRVSEFISDPQNLSEETRTLLNDMLETMYDARGIGIAAPQVGINLRAFIVDLNQHDAIEPYFVINPNITSASPETITLPEGCLSVRDINGNFMRAEVERPQSLCVKYYDLEGSLHDLCIDGTTSESNKWLVRVFEHENEHLLGEGLWLYIDSLK